MRVLNQWWTDMALKEKVLRYEFNLIAAALAESKGNVTLAAKALGIAYSSLRQKISAFGMDPKALRSRARDARILSTTAAPRGLTDAQRGHIAAAVAESLAGGALPADIAQAARRLRAEYRAENAAAALDSPREHAAPA